MEDGVLRSLRPVVVSPRQSNNTGHSDRGPEGGLYPAVRERGALIYVQGRLVPDGLVLPQSCCVVAGSWLSFSVFDARFSFAQRKLQLLIKELTHYFGT